MTPFGKLITAGVLVCIVAAGTGVYYLTHRVSSGPVACTMEAKLCPDGTAVGRSGPACEFAPCPATASSTVSL